MSDEIREHDEASIKKNLIDLNRGWDSVQIFVSREEVVDGEKRTIAASLGLGNWIQNGGVMHPGSLTEEPEDPNADDEQTEGSPE